MSETLEKYCPKKLDLTDGIGLLNYSLELLNIKPRNGNGELNLKIFFQNDKMIDVIDYEVGTRTRINKPKNEN